jgi:hypothetical protein
MRSTNIPGFSAEQSLRHSHERFRAPWTSEFAEGTTGLVQPARYACWQGGCACAGDDDCNAMFSGACGSGYARCWVRGSGPGENVFCLCAR